MSYKTGQAPSLVQPATYQIQTPGVLDESWPASYETMTLAVQAGPDGRPVTTLTATLDQAALHGLLRRLYALGLPILSVTRLA